MSGMPRLTLRLEGAGWLEAVITDGVIECSALASYFSDPLLDLLDALLALWYGADEAVAVWWEEPQADRPFEYAHWRLTRQGQQGTLQLRGGDQGFGHTDAAQTVFAATLTLEGLSDLLVDATEACIANLTDDDYREAWYDTAERQDIVRRFDEVRNARLGRRDDAVQDRLRQARPGDGGYWSDLVDRAAG